MNKYNRKLQKIISRHKLPTISEEMIQMTSDLNLDLFESACTNRRIALWGAGDGNENCIAYAIMQKYATYIQKAVCFIDSNPKLQGKQFLGLPIIAPEDIADWKIETIVITSGVYAQSSIKKACGEYAPQCCVVQPNPDIFQTTYKESNLYLYMNKLRIQYEDSNEELIKEARLKELITVCIQIKDFAFAYRYMGEYIVGKYADVKNIVSLKTEIESLLQQMHDQIRDRKKDILIFFPDRISREESKSIDMFSYLKGNVLSFADANSTGLYTYESMTSILKEEMPLGGTVYEKNLEHKVEDVPILTNAREKGYKIYVDSIFGYPIFEGEDIRISYSSFVSEKLWNVLCNMGSSPNKILDYLYAYETHYPELCGFHPGKTYQEIQKIQENARENYRTNYLDCLRYVDTVFEFYYKLLPEDLILIIHSDHSFLPTDVKDIQGHDKWLLSKQYCVEVPLLIQGADRTGEYQGMFSMIDFTKIVNQVINGEKLIIPEREIINYQMMPIHSRAWRKELIEGGKENYIDEIDIYVSREYIYLIAANKWEEVYDINDIYTDISDTEEGKAFIEIVKEYRAIS